MKHNKFTFLILSVLSTISAPILFADIISGHVLTDTSQPVVNAVVSDGYSVVLTNETGYYTFSRNDSTQFVFISVPEAYEIPLDDKGHPVMYQRIPDTGDFIHNFTLKPFADGGKADSTHVMIGMSDPQVRNNFDTWRYRNETIEDIVQLKNSYPEGTRFYGVTVGDLVWDAYTRLEEHKESCEPLGFPVFQVIGNHDHDMYSCGDSIADHYFKALFGPTYYSFNRGKIHYIVLDNIDYIGCNTKDYKNNITTNQINWLRKDLELVPVEKAVVILAHAPFEGSNVGNRNIVYGLLEGRRTTQHIITGHHHRLTNYEITSRLFDHTLGSTMGACWSSDYCSDGAPNGYGVFEAGDRGFNTWYYKATGKPRDFQFNAYPVNSVDAGDGKTDCIIANVWNFDSRWLVNIYEDGVKKVMQQYRGHDPMIFDLLAGDGDTRPNYPGSDGGTTVSQNPGSATTNHVFSYKPTNPDAEFIVEVTDRFGNVYTKKVQKNMMAASFTQEENEWVYRQDFNALPRFPNHFVSSTRLAKGAFVQGHMPEGWYASTSGTVRPTGTNTVSWRQFNYYRINNGDQADGWLYSYGEGDSRTGGEHDADRSIGSLVSSDNRCINFGVVIENNTGKRIETLEIEYTGKMWRAGTNPATSQSLTFSYGKKRNNRDIRDRQIWIGEVTGMNVIDSLSFHSPVDNTAAEQGISRTAINGNDAKNRQKITGKINISLDPGAVAILRWEDIDDAGDDHGLAIDDLTVRALFANGNSVQYVPEQTNRIYAVGKTLYFDEIPNAEVIVYDISGQTVFRQLVTADKLELTNIVNSGIYIVRVGSNTQKVIF